jgi:hypothetical protein
LTSNVSNPLHLLQELLKSEGDLQTERALKKTVARQTALNNTESIHITLFIYVSVVRFFKNVTPNT